MPYPKGYQTCDENDKDAHPLYKSWDGHHVKLVDIQYPDRYSTYEFLDSLPEKEREEIFEYNLPKMFFIDIETEIVDGFPEASDIKDDDGNIIKEGAATKVLAISVVYDDKVILMGLKDLSKESILKIETNTNKYFESHGIKYSVKYIKYDDEFDMLYTFFNKKVPKMSVLTGWNFNNYDWIYLVNRSRKLFKNINGKETKIDPRVSSPTNKLNKIWATIQEMPAHKMVFDYMQLYEICDTTIKVRESSSLDFVSKKLVGVDKIKYTGSLQRLYEDDFEQYMYYNTVDSVLVQKIHLSRNYISIIFAISSLSKIKVTDVISQMNNALGSLAITEGVLRNRFREQENIVLFRNKKDSLKAQGIEGGWVKDPVTGMNKWVVVYDFSSLYPTTMRQFFIAPENFIGLVSPTNREFCTNGKKINKDKHVVCINDVVFEKRNSPTIRMLSDVFDGRKIYKKQMLDKKQELKDIQNKIKELESEL